jgi:SAM-dependent methyltransferase
MKMGVWSRLRRMLRGSPESERSAYEAQDPFETGVFPVCPATHDVGLRRLFELSTILLLLDCQPDDRVLDLGAGAGFSSEMLARFGYTVVSLDPDHTALTQNRRRLLFDTSRIAGSARMTRGIAERLPFADATFDGVVAMHVLHHVSDLTAVTDELARVLRPGSRAVFCEPGLDHLSSPETERAIREFGENDRPFDVLEFLQQAKLRGFSAAMIGATLLAPMTLIPVEEIDLYRSGQHSRETLTPNGVIEEIHRHHAFGMIVRAGVRRKTSRYPGTLRCSLQIHDLPHRLAPGSTFTVRVDATNTGDTLWLRAPRIHGGFVTVGCKLLDADGRLITDRPGRTFLPKDVPPGDSVSVSVSVPIPPDLEPGPYRISFDLVAEQIRWFSDTGLEGAAVHDIILSEDG